MRRTKPCRIRGLSWWQDAIRGAAWKTAHSPIPFFKPGYVKAKRGDKLDSKAILCFYVGPAPNHLQDAARVNLELGFVTGTRNSTRNRVFHVAPVDAQRAISPYERS